jgi:signal transduction histidine kinase
MLQQIGGVIILAISCFEKILQRFKPAVFYFAALVVLLFSGIQAILQEVGVIVYASETPNLIQWSFIFEVIVIIIGILYRYKLMKQENDLLFSELNEQKLSSIQQILVTQQKEQQRIAEDLHDLLGGQLAAIKMKINALGFLSEKTKGISQLIDEVIVNTRNIAHNLAPIELHNNAISDIIATYVLQINMEQVIRFQFIQTGSPIRFNKEVELDIYKILMEIIQNILRHSEASEASIQFFFNERELEIIAEDNGKGFIPQKQEGMGIRNILKRIKNLRGKIHIDSVAGNTTFIIQIPLENE